MVPKRRRSVLMSEFFWMAVFLGLVQPSLARFMQNLSRQQLIRRIERARGSRVILLLHRQETMSFLGFPLLRYIDVEDAEEVIHAIRLTDPNVPLDLILHTPGGLVLASLQIARAIKRHPGKVTAFIPHYAMSGGTLIALAADEIVMSEHAALGPVDPQIGGAPAASLLRVLSAKPMCEIDDQTLVHADQAEKAIRQVRAALEELLHGQLPPEKCQEVVRLLSEGTWTHDFPISFEAAKMLGLPVRSDIPDDVLELMRLYSQPVRRQPGVEYLPVPYPYPTPALPAKR
jgi:ClpP class serine protease